VLRRGRVLFRPVRSGAVLQRRKQQNHRNDSDHGGGINETSNAAGRQRDVGSRIGSAAAQEKYPSEAIELIVPFAAGGSTNLGGRVLAKLLEAKWNVPVRIINKRGGKTVPAVSDVMRAELDGYTLLMDGPPQSSMLETVVNNLPFKTTDRTVPNDSPFKTLKDAADVAKSDPNSFPWTSLRGSGAQHMAFRQFFKAIPRQLARSSSRVVRKPLP
jgi:tripartite-type tricarboxylate transporter receptor subunit TctC